MIRLYGAVIVAASLLSTACVSVEKGAKEVHLADGDILIINALLVDGTGGPGLKGSLLVRNGRIVSIGNVAAAPDESSAQVIDAAGRVVAPGFIDTHAHGDPDRTPEFENFIAQGVTTICLGQDGSSPKVSEMPKWFDDAVAAKPGPNVALFVGHGTVRRESGIGLAEDPTGEQIETMAGLVREALALGCYGLTTGLEYQPGTFSRAAELAAIGIPVGEAEAVIMSHVRNEDDDQLESSLRELIEQGRAANAAVHVSHIKSVYGRGADRGEQIAEILAEGRRSGVRISADIYPYEASFTGLGILFPDYALPPNDYTKVRNERGAELADFLQRRVIRRNGPEATLLGTGENAGKTLAQIADASGKPFQEVLMEMGPDAGSAAYFVMNEDLQGRLLLDPHVNICSDGSPTMRHPRGYGSFPKVIRKCVVEDGALTIEEAVHKMSGQAASVVGLDKEKRGLLKMGYAADIVIFDPAKVRDTATFEEPFQLAEGIDTVLVNGVVVRHDGGFTGARSGKVLRRGAETISP